MGIRCASNHAKTSYNGAKTSYNRAISWGKCRNLINLINLLRIREGVRKAFKCLAHPLGEKRDYVGKCLVQWRAITEFINRSLFVLCVNVFQRGGKSIVTRRRSKGGPYIQGAYSCSGGPWNVSRSY